MSRVVAIYARVSTEHEAQLSALENQIQYYDDLLSKHPEWKLYDRYIDEGITGTSVRKRVNFMRMIEDAEKGCFDLIITREVSRFARNTVDTLQETRKLKQMGVEVYFIEDNIWTFNDEDGELKLTIMATLAQNESKKTSMRVKAGQMISFKNGVVYGTGNILGYDKIGKEMVVNEEQSKAVKFIFEQFLKGMGTTDIKYELEKRGIPTATGLSKWNVATIVRILRNPFYCGTVVYRKFFVPDFLEQKPKKNNGEVEQVVVEGKHTKLVSKEDFEKVQEILNSHSAHLPPKGKVCGVPKSIWSKKLVCKCGSSFNKGKYGKRKNGDITYCYQCYKQKNMGSYNTRKKRNLDLTGACDTSLVQEWKLVKMSKAIFDTIWCDKDRIYELASNLLKETINSAKVNSDHFIEKDLSFYKKKIEVNETKSKKLLDMYLSELLNKEDYISKKEELEKEHLNLKNKIKEIKENEPLEISSVEKRLKNLNDIINEIIKCEEVNEGIIDSFIEKIVVNNDSFDWYMKYLDGIINMKIEKKSKSDCIRFGSFEKNPLEYDCGTGSST